MKRIFILLLLLFLNSLLNAQQRFGFGVLQFGIGGNSSESGISTLEYEINIGYISFDISSFNEKTEKTIPGLSVTLIPINIKNMVGNNYLNLFNFQVYWDIFAVFNFDSIFGPFVSINYAPNLDFNNYILCAGVRFILTGILLSHRYTEIKSNILSFECSYKLFEGRNYIYFGLTFDAFTIVPGILTILFRA